MSPEAPENKTSEESTAETEQVAANNDTSRFSEDDMDTEIEVTPEENGEKKPRRKKKKKSDPENVAEDETRETSEERSEMKGGKKNAKEAKGYDEVEPPPYPHSDEGEKKKSGKKKRNLKKKVNVLLDTPFLFAAGVFVCVILPFSIYACDVIISVNVIDTESYRSAIISPFNNMSQLPMPERLLGEKYHIPDTVFITIQINSKPKVGNIKSRISRDVADEQPSVAETASDPTPASTASTSLTSTDKTDVAPASSIPASSTTTTITSSIASSTTTTNQTASTVSTMTSSVIGGVDSNVTSPVTNPTVETATRKSQNTTRKKPAKFIPRPGTKFTTLSTTTTEPANTTMIDAELWKKKEGEFCKGLYYFYEHHINYAKEYESDWFNDQSHTVYQKEQTLFFLFTIIGFISLLIGLGLRCDVFLSDEWSSFILVNLFLYSISMAITVSVFAQESGEGGLRCATCRFTTYCHDVDPWDYSTHWPAEPDTVQWSMVALISFILKLIDCYSIAIVTLKFIVDVTSDHWWVTCLKVFGWLLVFPLLIFTPMLGVARYQALPAVAPNDAVSQLVIEVFFYIGVVFWCLCLIALPFFCKMRMCSGSEDEEMQEEEELDY